MSDHTCPWCGPYSFPYGRDRFTNGLDAEPICPRCDLTPSECAYADRIIADSAAVLRQEWQAWEAKRQAEKSRQAS